MHLLKKKYLTPIRYPCMKCRRDKSKSCPLVLLSGEVQCVCCFNINPPLVLILSKYLLVITNIHSAICRRKVLYHGFFTLNPYIPAVTGTPECNVHFNVGTITPCLTQLISMLVHTEWLFWALLSLCHVSWGCVSTICFQPYYSFFFSFLYCDPVGTLHLS